MAIRRNRPARSDDWSQYQGIIERARKATGLRQVAMTQFDPVAGTARIVAITFGIGDGLLQRALAAVRAIAPRFDPANISFDVTVNPLNARVYLEGETVQGPLSELAGEIVPQAVLKVTSTMTGTAQGLICPLLVRGVVFGALGFNSRRRLTESQRLTCEAFTAEVALTLENRMLAEELTDRIDEMQRMRQHLFDTTPLLSTMSRPASEALSLGPLTLDTAARRVVHGSRSVDLTPKEFELLATLLRHAGQAISREHLSQAVWGYDAESSSNYVDVTVMHLRRKLEEEGAPRLVHAVRGYGYVARE